MGVVRRQVNRYASTLRRERTEAEDRVWQRIRNRQIGGFKWRFQHTVGERVGDFVCLEAMLIVEIDGSQHDEQVDRRRTAELEARGFAVIRFWNSDVFENLDGVLEAMLAAAQQRQEEVRSKKKTLTQPSPARGRGLRS